MADAATTEETFNAGGKAKRSDLVKAGGKSITDAVINHRIAAANGGFALPKYRMEQAFLELWRPCESNARREVLEIVIVIAGLVICRSGQVRGDQTASSIRGQPRIHGFCPAIEPVTKAGSGRHLLAIGFPWRRTDVITKAKSQSERGLQPPFVLYVKFVFIDAKSPADRITFRCGGASLIEIIESGYVTDCPQQLSEAVMKGVRASAVQRNGEAPCLRASGIARLKNCTTRRGPGRVDHKAGKRVCIRKGGVSCFPEFSAKTELMDAFGPAY